MFAYLLLWVQVLSEMLPISSSTQVALLQRLYEWTTGNPVTHIPEGLEYFLHIPLLIVVPLFFARSWWAMSRILLMRFWRKERLQSWSTKKLLWIIARLIAIIVVSGVIAEGVHQGLKLMGNISWFLPFGLMMTAGLLVMASARNPSTSSGRAPARTGLALWHSVVEAVVRVLANIRTARPEAQLLAASRRVSSGLIHSPYFILYLIGLAQACAFLPGISRMGATVCVALLCGLSVRRSLEFSFALQYPLVVAAVIFKTLPWLLKSDEAALCITPGFLTQLIIAGIVSYWVLKLAHYLFATCRSWIFGVYVIGCAVYLFIS
ncbi:undecaprenyl-diphosphate phosphatase [Candidatus Dependentiae bacterium]|nr:undecaprenyl-diphosphate phosphatase [Candidatus Dependentiae bacterium]